MRLFIAINLPPDVRRGIWDAAEPLRSASYPVKWVDADGIHLTLKFLGEVEDPREPEIVAGMQAAAAGARQFRVPISGFGGFPSSENPRVVWVGCEGVPPLEILQHRMEQEMERLGFPLEGRAFRPHVTLGRAAREARAADFTGAGEMLANLAFEHDVMVESVDLMESRLTPRGARYQRRHAAALPS